MNPEGDTTYGYNCTYTYHYNIIYFIYTIYKIRKLDCIYIN